MALMTSEYEYGKHYRLMSITKLNTGRFTDRVVAWIFVTFHGKGGDAFGGVLILTTLSIESAQVLSRYKT